MEPRRIDPHLLQIEGYPRVDWDAVGPLIVENVPAEGRHAAYTAVAREWLAAVRDTLGTSYAVAESEGFLLLSSLPARTVTGLLAFLERARTRLAHELLPGIADLSGDGKHVAIVIADRPSYYSYISYFYPSEGEFSGTSGVFVTQGAGQHAWGYGQFVCQGRDVLGVERTVVHELTHDSLSHLPLPGWLDEGLATSVESQLMGDGGPVVRKEDLEDHRLLWAEGGIQEFWSGDAVHRPDDRSRLAYPLARMIVHVLSRDFPRFRRFVLLASYVDAGEAAAVEVFGRGLGGVVEQLLGSGDWAPRPDTWTDATESEATE